VVAHPARGRQPRGRRGHLAPPACSHALAPPATGAPRAGLACLVAQRAHAAARTQSGQAASDPPTDHRATSAVPSALQACWPLTEPLDGAAAHRDLDRFLW
jgi:hypothetical protein